MYIGICSSTCATAVPGGHTGNDTHTRPDRTAHETGKAAHGPADDVVEELELRQGVLEVFRRSKKRDHGDLRAAQKRVRQPRALGAAG